MANDLNISWPNLNKKHLSNTRVPKKHGLSAQIYWKNYQIYYTMGSQKSPLRIQAVHI